MCDCLSSVVELVENATEMPDDLEYDCDRSALLTRTREVLHQLYKFGFEVICLKIIIILATVERPLSLKKIECNLYSV